MGCAAAPSGIDLGGPSKRADLKGDGPRSLGPAATPCCVDLAGDPSGYLATAEAATLAFKPVVALCAVDLVGRELDLLSPPDVPCCPTLGRDSTLVMDAAAVPC